MRAFDLLSNAEQEIRTVSHPRYHFEMVLLKWMHLRRLVPLVDLLTAGPKGPALPDAAGGTTVKSQIPNPKIQIPSPKTQIPSRAVPAPRDAAAPPVKAVPAPKDAAAPPVTAAAPAAATPRTVDPANLKDKLLAEIRSGKATFYNTVVAQAQRIEVTPDRITFVFGAAQSTLRGWFDQQKAWLDAAAQRIAGRKIAVVSELAGGAAPASSPEPRAPGADSEPEKKRDLKAEAMSSQTVQAMLDVFPAEIRDVEEM